MNTMQQEFDIITAHLYKQGRPAKDTGLLPTSSCFYRKETEKYGTLKCAIGCRIPDSRYKEQMEFNTYHNLMLKFGGRLSKTLAAYPQFYSAMQLAHDECRQNLDGSFALDGLSASLNEVAVKFLLIFNKPSNTEA